MAERERGMTLVEVMVVLAIMSLIMSVVGIQVWNRLKEAQRQQTAIEIKKISEALDLYKLRFRKYPNTSEGLAALMNPGGSAEPFLSELPKDAWENDYLYSYPGTRNPRGFDLLSRGPDGQEGTPDDIGNWKSADQP